ncbi:uncharacterized protein BDR25DRAFT_307039 [Lindgomyces ingoldianus]|uniref:Uncharacterized protein n=1 Tax=Lindgomyces ingoldianus TaxID=673940 RepID=A0ACB6QCR8_9PLEO|nr:uncharacterized protein BDR25DRAFT_307039 [Lindgomyces ingoldianus]KAF2464696.1 hypothetical protein BDR25DRAFT_307039 [Lindgomyces ingoldianus]
MTSRKDAHLYGERPKSRTKAKEISSSSNLAFSSQLSSLIAASSSTSRPMSGRARPKKEDIFATHNKNVKKRALKDLEDSGFTQQKHRGRTTDEKADDEATWRRTKRKMEEKARLYDALKRGDIDDEDEKYGVDFDQKWAERQERGEKDSDTDEESNASEESLVEYIDEFGRNRTGTRAEAAREERNKRLATDEQYRFSARPKPPENVIYGDMIQKEAFNPDETIMQQMAELAAKRDKEPTPPPPEHFDGRKEIRLKGTGFFAFSTDEEERQQQMSNLEKERQETEKAREVRKKQKEERAKLIAEKRKAVQQKKAKSQADRFLDSLGGILPKGEKEG